VAGLITIPTGYYQRLKTIAEQQEKISELQTERLQEDATAAKRQVDKYKEEEAALTTQVTSAKNDVLAMQTREKNLKDAVGNANIAVTRLKGERQRLEATIHAEDDLRQAARLTLKDPQLSVQLAVNASQVRSLFGKPLAETEEILKRALFAASHHTVKLSESSDEPANYTWSPLGDKIALTREKSVVVLDTGR
jgi:chromosome segregation ATPase